MSPTKTTPRIILGTQSFALKTTDPETSDFRVQGAENVKPFLDCLESFGVLELDTARVYCEGDTETVLGQVAGQPLSRFEISTKVYPLQPGDHAPTALTQHLYRSFEQLKVGKVKIFYLHAPDFFTPFEDTLKAVDDLHRDGLFEEAGGFLTGNYTIDGGVKDGTRFDTKTVLGSYYRSQYWTPLYFDAVEALKCVAQTHNIPLLEASIRWMNHHSGLGPEDGLIFGANDRVEDLKQNLISLQKGPLPEDVVQAFEDAWEKVKAANQTYFRRDIRVPQMDM
ncbi:hypothetical protein BGZ50_002268 [Haplosporangium sp. Z 11]|nr:hypothetical protein BGZ50_002268 [Haplosporangium sp. Z 11]